MFLRPPNIPLICAYIYSIALHLAPVSGQFLLLEPRIQTQYHSAVLPRIIFIRPKIVILFAWGTAACGLIIYEVESVSMLGLVDRVFTWKQRLACSTYCCYCSIVIRHAAANNEVRQSKNQALN